MSFKPNSSVDGQPAAVGLVPKYNHAIHAVYVKTISSSSASSDVAWLQIDVAKENVVALVHQSLSPRLIGVKLLKRPWE